ncbi:MAG: hypothetical protein QOK32_433, partial [Gaiellaceae bacterium]|nr:hypothetical protein [Gaiellaceae bacterium]
SGRVRLIRVVGASCDSTAAAYADDLVSGETYFAYQGPSTQSLAALYVCIPVNPKKGATKATYALTGTIAFRNSIRSGTFVAATPPVCT